MHTYPAIRQPGCFFEKASPLDKPGESGAYTGVRKLSRLLVTILFLLIAANSWAESAITGPVSAKVFKVYDGDTITVEAYLWPGLEAKVSVRINGVDTPEIREKCEAEKQKAIEARDFVKKLILGKMITLQNIKHGKYANRVVANVFLRAGESLAEKIVMQGLGREYHGGAI